MCSCHLFVAKSKVSPLKRVIIPLLELCGTVLVVKLLHFVHETIKAIIPIDVVQACLNRLYNYSRLDSFGFHVDSPHRWATHGHSLQIV